MQVFSARGLTPKTSRIAATLTVPGSQERVREYLYRQHFNQSEAQQAVQMALAGRLSRENPYSAALGDGEGGFDWSGVVKTFVGVIGQGVANRIGGHAPPAQTIINQAPATPGWVKWAVIGGAVGIPLALLVTSRRRK